jgi:septum formation protein
LAATGLPFVVRPAEVDESPRPGEGPEATVLRLTALKAGQVTAQMPHLPVVSADTVVALGDKIFGKPASLGEAKATLMALSGKVHRVITGYGVFWPAQGRERSGLAVTDIGFRRLIEPEIDWYLSLGQSLDKAGAYALQSEGGFLTDRIEGSYTNAIGLPLKETLEALSQVLGRAALP